VKQEYFKQQSNRFRRYHVAHRRPTKLCTIFGRLLGWYIIYTFLGALAP